MRVLGVDFGRKRIGIAVGETDHGISSARQTLGASGTLEVDARNIAELARKEQAEAVVLGVPNNPDFSDKMEKVCILLAEKIRAEGFKVFTVNEALTSIESEKNLSSVYNRSELRKKIDGEAARLILARFFNGES